MNCCDKFYVRSACYEDIPRLCQIFDQARRYMRDSGNMVQWVNGYPSEELLRNEIDSDHCKVIVDRSGEIRATFCVVAGEDPTYKYIEGEWKHLGAYVTIHRLASDGAQRGMFDVCMRYCKEIAPGVIRADTHEDNFNMRRLLESQGFEYCGIIYVADGTPRLAYSLSTR